jgi:atypical dual specificity phosphatase
MEPNENLIRELRFGFIGGYPVAGMGEPWAAKIDKTHEVLRNHGVGGILTLTEEDLYGNQHKNAGFMAFHEPIDDCQPPSMAGMDRAIAFINACLDRGTGVAVHCFEGRGRTGTVLAAWLAGEEGLMADQAIARIHELRWHTVLTPSQKAFLTRYLNDRH